MALIGIGAAFVLQQMESIARPITQCLHCGASFALAPNTSSREAFCCSGCKYVYELINGMGLQNFYELKKLDPPACPLPAQVTSENFDYCDDPNFLAKMASKNNELDFYLEGLNCTACLWLLEKLPQLCPDAKSVKVNMATSSIHIEKNTDGAFSNIAQALARFGFKPHVVQKSSDLELLRQKERKMDLIRIGVGAAATGNIMIFAVSLYAGATGELASQFRWLVTALAFPVLTFSAMPFYKSAWGSLRARALNIDVPIVAALIAGIAMSIWGLLSHRETMYFDSLSMLVFLLLSSRFWLKGIQQKYLSSSYLEDHLLTRTVSRLVNNIPQKVSSLSLEVNDLVLIENEMPIPADGIIVSGEGTIQTAVLTGETDPTDIKPGDHVEAGTQNLRGQWILKVLAKTSDSRIARILRDSQQSSANKPHIVEVADKVSQWFVGLTMSAALAVGIYFMTSNPVEGFSRALALIIVTCPCVFGMAIPLSMSLALGAAAKRGIIIRNSQVIERLLQVKNIFFDKTGTLTHGELQVLSVECSDKKHLAAIPALEAGQSHPIAKTLRHYFMDADSKLTAKNTTLLSGGGISGQIDGVNYFIRPLDLDIQNKSNQIKANYGLYCETFLVAKIQIGDRLRSEAAAVVSDLRSQGYRISLISGDQGSTVQSCATALGLNAGEFFSRLSPEQKSEMVARYANTNLMIGDGANDAGALAKAGVGVAMRGSLDISLHAADVYLMRPDLNALTEILAISKSTKTAIIRNLVFSASFNLVSGTLALTGYMNPLLAAVLMPLSSLTVLVSALATGKNLNSAKESA